VQKASLNKAIVLIAVSQLLCLAVMPASAQRGQSSSAPSLPTPRLPDGTVDLSGDGVWDLPWITNFGSQLVGRDSVPFLPWTKAMHEYNASNNVAYDPEGFCLPPGGPRSFGTPYPAEIIQHRDRIIMIFEGGGHVWREIHMDGRPHPDGDALNPTYFGHSVGRWEGDTLVIETEMFAEHRSPYGIGLASGEQKRTVERYTLNDDGRALTLEVFLEDPEYLAESFSGTLNWDYVPDFDFYRYDCDPDVATRFSYPE